MRDPLIINVRSAGRANINEHVTVIFLDDAGVLALTQRVLSHCGYSVLAGARGAEVQCSAGGVLVAVRQEITRVVGQGLGPRQWQDYQERLQGASVEPGERRSAKERRPWPRREPHKPPKPPRISVPSDDLKARLEKELNAA